MDSVAPETLLDADVEVADGSLIDRCGVNMLCFVCDGDASDTLIDTDVSEAVQLRDLDIERLSETDTEMDVDAELRELEDDGVIVSDMLSDDDVDTEADGEQDME
jgi:hypothetical protein